MKKILALSWMFLVFAPFNVFAITCSNSSNGLEWDGFAFTIPCTPGGGAPAGTGLSGGAEDVSHLVSFLGAALNVAVRLILGAAVVFFLWGVFQFVRSAGDEEARKIGKDHIIYGVIGIAIMVSVYGLVNFVTGSIGLDTTTGFTVPKLLPMPN